jgi:glycosyltransferase involved in cell wall biosynthesis
LGGRHPLNRLAAPTKFAEYVLCGLPVLISPDIGDYSEYVAANEAGLVISPEDEVSPAVADSVLAMLENQTIHKRRQLSADAAQRFSLETSLAALAKNYLHPRES